MVNLQKNYNLGKAPPDLEHFKLLMGMLRSE